ncbi:YchJ family protein [Sphingobacterium suaedae]|uniref:YchJ family protein n=1 Tax=Sphingobacterium suaedae TaxID=1686402 RepID=A0ABW5KD08_9SPHI
MEHCLCGSEKAYEMCCARVHEDLNQATSAEDLMRARYTAFARRMMGFIYDSFHPVCRRHQNRREIEQWARENEWLHLDIIKCTYSTVEFKAHYLDVHRQVQIHHEKSAFKQLNGTWFYVSGKVPS